MAEIGYMSPKSPQVGGPERASERKEPGCNKEFQKERIFRLLIFGGQIETGWYLGPGTLCCNACTWANVSSSNKVQRNYEGLKITACTRSWGKLWTTRYKKTKHPAATSEEPGAKAGDRPYPLHTPPPKGWVDHLNHPSSPPPDAPLPSPHSRNKLAAPREMTKGTCCSTRSNKALPEFPVCPLINFY